jgi:hypothetical protein
MENQENHFSFYLGNIKKNIFLGSNKKSGRGGAVPDTEGSLLMMHP